MLVFPLFGRKEGGRGRGEKEESSRLEGGGERGDRPTIFRGPGKRKEKKKDRVPAPSFSPGGGERGGRGEGNAWTFSF